MQFLPHLAISWFIAEGAGLNAPRHRRAVTLAGLAPDIDSLAYVGAYFVFGFDLERAHDQVWTAIHHRYTHGIGFSLVTGIVVYLWSRRSPDGSPKQALTVAGLALVASLVHVFCDVVGAGSAWPVYAWWPLGDVAWTVDWSWPVSDWRNTTFSLLCLAGLMLYARFAGYSALETASPRLDRLMVRILQTGSDRPAGGVPRASGRLRWLVYGALAVGSMLILFPLWRG